MIQGEPSFNFCTLERRSLAGKESENPTQPTDSDLSNQTV